MIVNGPSLCQTVSGVTASQLTVSKGLPQPWVKPANGLIKEMCFSVVFVGLFVLIQDMCLFLSNIVFYICISF